MKYSQLLDNCVNVAEVSSTNHFSNLRPKFKWTTDGLAYFPVKFDLHRIRQIQPLFHPVTH